MLDSRPSSGVALVLSLVLIAPVTPARGGPPGPAPAGLTFEKEVHLKNVRQLTFGGQNAEAYWSPDGARLV